MTLDSQQLMERLSEKDRDVEQEVDVEFTFSHEDFDYLIPLAEDIGNTFADKLNVEYDAIPIDYDEFPSGKNPADGEEKLPPQFSVTYTGPLTAAQFAILEDLATGFAKQHGLNYLGVTAWYPRP